MIQKNINDRYIIYDDGRILNTKSNKYIKHHIRKVDGYVMVNLDGKTHYLHRLLALAFIPNPKNLPVVNHIDYNTGNFNLNNLEWCTQKENTIHSIGGNKHYLYGKLGKDSEFQLKKKKKIIQLSLQNEEIKIWDSAIDVYRELKISYRNISSVCYGKRKSAGGYKWKFK